MEPAQVTGEVLGGNTAAGPEKILQPRVTIVDGLDVEFAADALTGSLVEDFVGDAQGGGAGGIAGAAIGDQQGIGADDRLEGCGQGRRGHRGQDRADGRTGTVGSDQDRNLFVGQAALLRLAASLAGLAIGQVRSGLAFLGPLPDTIPLPALQDKGFIRLDNALQLPAAGLNRVKEAMTPAESGAHRHAAALGRSPHRIALGQAGPKRQPLFLAVKPGYRRAGQGAKGPAAGLAEIALQTPRLAIGNRSGCPAVGTTAVLSDTQFDRRKRRLSSRPTRQNLRCFRLLRLRQAIDFRQPRLKHLPFHHPNPPAFPPAYSISIRFTNRALFIITNSVRLTQHFNLHYFPRDHFLLLRSLKSDALQIVA